MATPDETKKIREELEKQANKRVNPLLKGLSMLTGGIAGEFTGTNEQIRQQRQAKRTLMAEEVAALEDQRILERARITREEELKRRIAEKAAEDEARLLEETRKSRGAEMALKGEDMVGPLDPATMAGMAAAKAAQARVQAERINALKGRETEMRGYLAGRGVQLGDPDVETVAFLEAQERSKEALKKEQDTKMQLMTPSGSVVYGSYDELAKKYPALTANISVAKTKESKPLDVSFREADGEYVFNFGPGVSPEEAAKYKQDVYKAFGTPKKDDLSGEGAGGEGTKTFPKAPPVKEGEPMVGRSDGKARSAAAAAVAAQARAEAEPQALGPMSPEQEFSAINRKLAEMEARGGSSAYGARQTLTTPFYTDVASELNVQPEQVGGSVYQRTPRTVVSQNFPAEQFRNLPQEVQNRLYIEAMNKSAQAMRDAKYKPSGTFSEYQLNDPWMGSMFDKLSR
jgi:hypothetical protein